MSGDLNSLNKWRMAQFHKNNEPDQSGDADFVCLSPSAYNGNTDDDCIVLFASDTDNDIVTDKKKSESDGHIAVDKSAENFRLAKRVKKADDVVYTHVSDSDSDDANDPDFVIEKPKRKRPLLKTSRPAAKVLSLKSIPVTRKTAVVIPITKPRETPTLASNDVPKHNGNAKRLPSTPPKPESLCLIDELLNSPVVITKGKHLNSPVAITNAKCLNSLTEVTKTKHLDSPAAVPRDKYLDKTELDFSKTGECNSDSDISLFEVSFDKNGPEAVVKDPSAAQVVRNVTPVDTTTTGISNGDTDSPRPFNAVQPLDTNGFSSDSSEPDIATKKRASKGKQPANKRKKVVAKRSKPLSEQSSEHNHLAAITTDISAAVTDSMNTSSAGTTTTSEATATSGSVTTTGTTTTITGATLTDTTTTPTGATTTTAATAAPCSAAVTANVTTAMITSPPRRTKAAISLVAEPSSQKNGHSIDSKSVGDAARKETRAHRLQVRNNFYIIFEYKCYVGYVISL